MDRNPDAPHRVRYLTDDERSQLLKACRASSWPKLYVLVLMALTTGARAGFIAGTMRSFFA